MSVGARTHAAAAPYDRVLLSLSTFFATLWLLELARDVAAGHVPGSRSPGHRGLLLLLLLLGYAAGLLAVLRLIEVQPASARLAGALTTVVVLATMAGWMLLRLSTLSRISGALSEAAVTTPWPPEQIDERLVALVSTHVRAAAVGIGSARAGGGAVTEPLDAERFLLVHRDPGDFAFSRDDARLIAGLASMARASHEHTQRETHLHHEATTDQLTGLAAFSHWRELLDADISDRYTGERVGVLFLDLDRFKQLNGTYGHLRADLVLAEVGRRLAGFHPHTARFGRFGGDEFVGVIRNLRSEDQLHDECRELARAISRPVEADGEVIEVAASIGRVLSRARGDSPDRLIGQAEQDMRRRKQGLRGATSLTTDTELVRGVLAGGLDVAYQPVLDVVTGRVEGVEALLRGSVPALGRLSPIDVVDSANRVGLLDTVTRSITDQALATVEELGRRHDLPLVVSVNVEFDQLRWDSDFLDWVTTRVEGLRTHLILELSERGTEEWTAEHDLIAQDLGRHGIGWAIDDLGSGQSRFPQLLRRQWEWVKLDRGFIVGDQSRGRVMVRHLTRMMHDLDMRVVLEGIETDDDLGFATDAGVDLVQGHLLSRPLLADALAGFLDRGASRPMGVVDRRPPVP